jgi:acetyl-CoA C-acetyltransferase
MESAYIYDAVRTPRGKGKQDGSLHRVKPVRLLAGLLTALASRNRLDPADVDDVIAGCASATGEQGAAIGKAAALLAGWPDTVPGMQLDRFCASGLEAVNIAAAKVMSGMESLVVAGGVESMSRVPMGAAGGAIPLDPELMNRAFYVAQGVSADLIATLGGYTREKVDEFALHSQQKAAAALAEGWFRNSVVPVRDRVGELVLAQDEFGKPDTTMEILARLKPSFAKMGALGMDQVAIAKYPQVQSIIHVHTAGNSSGVVDGASAVLIGSRAAGERFFLRPRARIVTTAVVGSEPTIMLTGPAPAVRKLLAKAGMSLSDIDLFEVNEAFASVVLRFMDELGVPEEQVNVCGGAIALGHPIAATGGMLVATLLDELERRQLRRGIVALCAGAGMGIAALIERV